MKKRIVSLVLMAMLLGGCSADLPEETTPTESKPQIQEQTGISVQKVEELPEDFIMGADVSSLIAQENSGVIYRDFEGHEQDLIKILADAGLNYIRVRVWNDPYDAQGNGYGGGNCDLNTALAIGKRATENGMQLLVDFHYSDFWADPGKQQAPKAWEGMTLEQKKDAIAEYTRSSLQTLQDAGVAVGMVQIGNETTGGMCGEWTAEGQYTLMAEAAAAVRQLDRDILIAVHYTNPERGGYAGFAQKLKDYHVDYDVFASSYYPAYHGTLNNLIAQLRSVANGYGKKVMIAETAWDNKTYDASEKGAYPYSVQGQATALRDLIEAMNSLGEQALGVFYWEPAWIEVPGSSWEERSQIWEQYGSGWASSFAGEYDPQDAGKYYGGSACTKQAWFDEQGYPLESLLTFQYVRNGKN